MSYCHFSSDDYQCNVHVSKRGPNTWVVRVAKYKPVFREPLPPKVDPIAQPFEWLAREKRIWQLLETADQVPIGGPYDGMTFYESSPLNVAKRLVALIDAGYVVPQFTIDSLLKEASHWRPPSKESKMRCVKCGGKFLINGTFEGSRDGLFAFRSVTCTRCKAEYTEEFKLHQIFLIDDKGNETEVPLTDYDPRTAM